MISTNATSIIELSCDQLGRLHQVQLTIADKIKAICDKHELEYFLMAGTLLGAVRHSGFIPWDDDMDIGMPRESYDKFIAVAPDELGSDHFIQTLETDAGYGLSFAKIRLNGTRLVETSSANTSAHNGIFVDIFPFDNVPDNKWKRRLHSILTSNLKRAILLHQGYEPWFDSGRTKSMLYRSAVPLAKALPKSTLIKLLDRVTRWFNSEATELMTAIGGSYGYQKESIKRRWLGGLPETIFENTRFKCLEGSPDYLSELYGEYMKPPAPEHQRSRHGITALDFGVVRRS